MSNVWIFASLEGEIVPSCSLMYSYLVGKGEHLNLSLKSCLHFLLCDLYVHILCSLSYWALFFFLLISYRSLYINNASLFFLRDELHTYLPVCRWCFILFHLFTPYPMWKIFIFI